MPADVPGRWYSPRSPAPSERERQTAADKRLYVEMGMVPIACRQCGAEVLVKKNSAKHTSVQWTCDPATTCPEFAQAARAGSSSARITGCPLLWQSIEDAVARGAVVVPGG